MRSRTRRIEKLESRQLLTAYINEVLFAPLFGDQDTDQYVELRGERNTALDDGTYLLVVESGKGVNNSEGKIEAIFDLSGLVFGDNGFLVLQEQNSPFTSDPLANTLKSTAPGFSGLPGNIFSDVHDLSDRLDFIYASNTIFLIQSDIAPNLGDDIDTNSDGFIDEAGVFANWNVLDSVSTLWSLNDGYGYGKIVFIDRMGHNPAVTLPTGTTLVELEGTGYVGRIGNSTGWAASDWVGGTVKDMSDDNLFIRFAGDVHGRPRPIVFQGRELDNLGSENFTAAVRASFFRDLDGDGFRDANEVGLTDVQILADTNANGQRDLFTTIIEPDAFNLDTELNNLTKGVSLSTAVDDNVIIGFDIQAVQNVSAATGTRVFSHAGVGFFNTTRRFRADFYRPAQQVSIDVIGDSNSTPTYGRLEVFDAAGNSLRIIRTGPLGANALQTLTIDMGSDVIAYAVAYPDNDYLNSSPFGKLDRFTFSVPEAIASTNAQGIATLNYLDPDDYLLIEYASNSSFGYQFDPIPIRVTEYENFKIEIPVRVNEPPQIAPQTLTVAENSPGNTVIGTIIATDEPGQALNFTLINGTQFFTLDAATGVLKVKNGVSLNYELRDSYVFRVRVTDNANSPLSSEAEITVSVIDVNEPPVMNNYQFEAQESPLLGGLIGTVQATDPDSGPAGQLGYRIVGENPSQAFLLNDVSGELTVNNPAAFNYESATELTISVQAYDFGDPSRQITKTVTVSIIDLNEAPQIISTEFSIGELAAAGTVVGRVQVTDPETIQSHTFRWADGFSTDVFDLDFNTGDIRVAAGATLNFLLQDRYEVPVHVADSGLPTETAERTLVIHVVDENNPPVIDDAILSIPEDISPLTQVGILTASDTEPGSLLTLAIVGGNGASKFSIGASDGVLTVADGAEFDFESAEQWQIVVTVSDNGTPSQSTARSFTVSVTNVNEAPQGLGGTFLLAENAIAGNTVGQVAFVDPDNGDSPSASILEAVAANRFSIDPDSGEIKVADGAALDFETEPEISFTVRIIDDGELFVDVPVTISITNVNEPPTTTGTLEKIPVTAALEFSHSLPDDLFSEVDAGQVLTLTLKDHTATWLSFDPTTRTLAGLAWNGSVGEHSFTLVATDNGIPPLSTELDFTIEVTANASPWKNPGNPFDVNGRSEVTPTDALVIINFLNRSPLINIPTDINYRPAFLDVNGNNKLEPIDALQVINYLNRRGQGQGEGEGQGPVAELGDTISGPQHQPNDLGLMEYLMDPITKRRRSW